MTSTSSKDFGEKRVLLDPLIVAAKHDRAAEKHADWMRAFTFDERPKYEGPRSDDPREWTGLLAYTYHDWLYREHCRRAYILRLGKRLVCPPCGEKHDRTTRRRLCLDHAWDSWGERWAIQGARWLARGGWYPGPITEIELYGDRSARIGRAA